MKRIQSKQRDETVFFLVGHVADTKFQSDTKKWSI